MSSWMAFVHTGNPNIAEMRGKWQQFGPSSVVMRWDCFVCKLCTQMSSCQAGTPGACPDVPEDGFDGWVEDAKFLEHRKGLLARSPQESSGEGLESLMGP
eukprot:s2761_g4.t1